MLRTIALISVCFGAVLCDYPNRAPYPASGWKPAGEPFTLSERQQAIAPKTPDPRAVYGPPAVPVPVTTTEADSTTTELPSTTTERQSNRLESAEQNDGVYYIYHQSSGALQKITYNTKNDVGNMEYFARLRYENVQPIQDPIYAYDPETLVLQRIQV